MYPFFEIKLFSAFELYADPKSDELTAAEVGALPLKDTEEAVSSAERFKKAFSYEGVKVHFVGAWCVLII